MAFNLFENILGTKQDPTQGLLYKTLSKFEPSQETKQTFQNVTGALGDTAKMYEKKAQGISQWSQGVANNPGLIALGKAWKEKYPDTASFDDVTVGKSVLEKYPEYQTYVDSKTTALGYGAKALGGIGSMAVSAPGMVAGGLGQYGEGLGTLATAQSGQDYAKGLLQATKGGVTAGFGVATGAMPIASTVFGGATGFEPVQKGLGYVADKAGDISEGTAKFLGGNEKVQEQARGLGEIALPAVALGGISKSGKIVKPVAKATGKAIVKSAEAVAPKVVQGAKSLVTKTPQVIGKGVTSGTEYSTSLATGLSRQTQQTIKNAPNLYKEARLGNITAQGELGNFVKATEARLTDLSELGKGYDSVKRGNIVAKQEDVIGAYLKATEGVKDTHLTKADRLVLKDANDYTSQMKGNLNESDVLALRKQLDSIMYDPNTSLKRKLSPTGERVVQSMRAEIDKIAKERIQGLKELDAQYAPEVSLLKDVKKQIYDANGNIKPTALSTIANIVGKNKDFKLEQFQKIYPELGARIKALKAFEEVQALGEIKTGSIVRQGGAIAFGSAVAPGVGTFIGWIATNPGVVARILEAYGVAKAKIQTILKKGDKITPEEIKIVQKAVTNTPKQKAEDIMNNLSYDAKRDTLTSRTVVGPKKLSTIGKIEVKKAPESPVALERGYTTAIKKPIVKRSADVESGNKKTIKLFKGFNSKFQKEFENIVLDESNTAFLQNGKYVGDKLSIVKFLEEKGIIPTEVSNWGTYYYNIGGEKVRISDHTGVSGHKKGADFEIKVSNHLQNDPREIFIKLKEIGLIKK